MPIAALVAVSVVALGGPPDSSAPPPEPAAPSSSAPKFEDPRALSLDELIKRLPPAGEEWVGDAVSPFSEEMGRRLEGGLKLTDEQWKAALFGTRAIVFRERWPKNEAYAARLTVPRWLGLTQIRLVPKNKALQRADAGELMWSFSGTFPMIRARDARFGLPMGVIPPETEELEFGVEVERGQDMPDFGEKKEQRPPPGLLWSGTVRVPIALVASWSEAVPAAPPDPGLDEAVRDAVSAANGQWGSSQALKLYIDPDCGRYPGLLTTALSLKAELLEDGKPVADERLCALDADTLMLHGSVRDGKRFFCFCVFQERAVPEADAARFAVRLTGTDECLRAQWHGQRRWTGALTIPLTDLLKHESDLVGAKGTRGFAYTPSMR